MIGVNSEVAGTFTNSECRANITTQPCPLNQVARILCDE
jgi:hypothetical protein